MVHCNLYVVLFLPNIFTAFQSIFFYLFFDLCNKKNCSRMFICLLSFVLLACLLDVIFWMPVFPPIYVVYVCVCVSVYIMLMYLPILIKVGIYSCDIHLIFSVFTQFKQVCMSHKIKIVDICVCVCVYIRIIYSIVSCISVDILVLHIHCIEHLFIFCKLM